MTASKQHTLGLTALGSLALMAALAGCATGASDNGETVSSRSGPLPSDCIMGGSIRDYTALDDQNLILYGPGRRPYHVVLVTRAIGLESEFRIGVYDRDAALGGISRICPYGGDAIIVDGPFTERVPIRSIELIDDDGVEALRVRFGQAEPAADDAVTVTEITTAAESD